MTEMKINTPDRFRFNETPGMIKSTWRLRAGMYSVEINKPSKDQFKEVCVWLTQTFGHRIINGYCNKHWELNKIMRLEADIHYNYKGDKIGDDPYEEHDLTPVVQISMSEQAFIAFKLKYDLR